MKIKLEPQALFTCFPVYCGDCFAFIDSNQNLEQSLNDIEDNCCSAFPILLKYRICNWNTFKNSIKRNPKRHYP